MKWIALIALLATGNTYAEIWACEMQPRVLGEPRHGETVTHTFTVKYDEEAGFDFVDEQFTLDLQHNEEWLVLRENDYLIELIEFSHREQESQHAVLFKKAKRAVKTLVMSDISTVLVDQGDCEISEAVGES